MPTVARLEAVLRADVQPFMRDMDRAEGKMHRSGKVAAAAGLAIAGGLAVGLDKSIHAAVDAQKSQARLQQAFKTAHLSATKYAGAVEEVEGKSRKLGFTDEDVKNSLGSLLVATHSMSKATKDLAVAQDIARFKGISLEAATKMLTMAQAGSQRATKQLGLSVQAVTDAQDKAKVAWHAARDALKAQEGAIKHETDAQKEHFQALKDNIDATYQGNKAAAQMQDHAVTSAKVIALVSEKLHGQADAYSKTAAGSMEQFKAQLNALEVSMGTALLPILAQVAGALARGVAFFSKHTTAAKLAAIALGALAAALLAAKIQQIAFNIAVEANPYVLAITGLVALGVALYVFRDKIKTALGAVKSFTEGVLDWFKGLPGRIGDAIGGAIGDLKDKIKSIFDWHRILKWVKDALDFHSPAPWAVQIGADIVGSIAHGVGGAAGVLKDAVWGLAKKYGIGFAEKVAGGIAAPFQENPLGGGGSPNRGGPGGPKQLAQFGDRIIGSSHEPVVKRVAEAVGWAYQHGWRGTVTSGFRTYQQQAALYQRYLAGGPLAAPPGTSSHESGQAVDVTDYGTFARLMTRAPAWAKLYNRLGGADPVHFSVSGYDKGGWLPPGVSLAVNATGRPERVLPPGSERPIIVQMHLDGNRFAQLLIDPLRRQARMFENRNGRLAFGGGG